MVMEVLSFHQQRVFRSREYFHLQVFVMVVLLRLRLAMSFI